MTRHQSVWRILPVCSILENNVSVGRIAAEELIHTECKRIAFAAHSFDDEAIQDRQLGLEAVAQAGDGVTFQLYRFRRIDG